MASFDIHSAFEFIKKETAETKVKEQNRAKDLLFEPIRIKTGSQSQDSLFNDLCEILSESSSLLNLTPVQNDIFHSDSGTAFVPMGIKKALLSIKSRFVVRPGNFQDLQNFVKYAYQNKIQYTLRGAGTWPFGGSIPMNNDVILDISYLDFFNLHRVTRHLTVAAGVIFANARQFLRDQGFSLRQDITNPHSGTICGWIATGGIGIGAYKYGHVKNSVEALLVLTPQGEWLILNSEDEEFDSFFGSEGQIGIIAGAILKINQLSYVTKPYAYSFEQPDAIFDFISLRLNGQEVW